MSVANVTDVPVLHGRDFFESQYKNKPDDYFFGARSDFIGALPYAPDAKILEIGCGSGATGSLALNNERCGHYTGIELDERAAQKARGILSDVRIGNVEEMELTWTDSEFDAVIMSEVLEHLIDPWSVVSKLAPLIRPGGTIMASSPNVSHYSVILEQMKGNWNLTDSGVMDRTHMRWFTPNSFRAMFENAGFEVIYLEPMVPFSWKTRMISRLTAGRLDHLFTRQIVVHARRK